MVLRMALSNLSILFFSTVTRQKRHVGKVVLKIRDEEPEKTIVPAPVRLKALSRTTCDPEKSYVIIGGLGGFGLELCQWLVQRGAKHVVLTSRSGLKTGYQKLCMNRWKKENVNIIVSKLNATKADDARAILKMAAEVKPVAAVFNLALVLRDALMENQTVEKFKEVYESKVSTTSNLDAASREFCPELEWFVCFSSLSSGRGNAGQSNYGYANSAMERICEERFKEGLPGLAIQWGAIGDVGVIQDTVGSEAVVGGSIPQRINSCLTVLDKFLLQKQPVLSSFVPCETSENTSQKASKCSFLDTVGKMFGIKEMSAINPETSLGELGMDSLLRVEVKQFLERDLNIVLENSELRHLKVKDLQKLEGSVEKMTTATTSEYEGRSTSDSNATIAEKIPGYISSLHSKQLVPTETIIKMNSVETGIPLFIVHPIEGTVALLNSLAKLVNFPVYGIQCTPEAPSESIEQLAVFYWKNIQALNISDAVCLAGYSFGAVVAFEMCLLAELYSRQHPEVRSLTMLDGSPGLAIAFTRKHKSHFGNESVAEEKTEALCSFMLQFVDINIMEVKKELKSLPSLADRVKKSVEIISTTCNNLQPEDLKLAFELYYKKLLALKYVPRRKLKKEVTLIKASHSADIKKSVSENYDLDRVCDGKITVFTVKGTHSTFILEEGAKEVSLILNDILSH